MSKKQHVSNTHGLLKMLKQYLKYAVRLITIMQHPYNYINPIYTLAICASLFAMAPYR